MGPLYNFVSVESGGVYDTRSDSVVVDSGPGDTVGGLTKET